MSDNAKGYAIMGGVLMFALMFNALDIPRLIGRVFWHLVLFADWLGF